MAREEGGEGSKMKNEIKLLEKGRESAWLCALSAPPSKIPLSDLTELNHLQKINHPEAGELLQHVVSSRPRLEP